MNKDIFVNFITNHFNHCVAYGEFADELEHADYPKGMIRQITDQKVF